MSRQNPGHAPMHYLTMRGRSLRADWSERLEGRGGFAMIYYALVFLIVGLAGAPIR